MKEDDVNDNIATFIENRNFAYTSRHCFGMTIAINEDIARPSVFKLGCVLRQDLNSNSFTYLSLKDTINITEFYSNKAYKWK